MGLFNNIFDNLSNNVSDFFSGNDSAGTYITAGKDILGAATALGANAGGQAAGGLNQASGAAYRDLQLTNRLDLGTSNPLSRLETRVPIHSRNEFAQTEATNPMVLENEWDNRLQRYSEITRMTGVSETGR
jgi:hypothetical protein